jgi:hypothetical protein
MEPSATGARFNLNRVICRSAVMDYSTESQLDAALAVRRRLRAELIASEATDDAMPTSLDARLKLKLQHLDSVIERFERELGDSGWLTVRQPANGSVAQRTY